jgi:hypothetical protein
VNVTETVPVDGQENNQTDLSTTVVTNLTTVITTQSPTSTTVRSTTTTEVTIDPNQEKDTKGENLKNLFTFFVKTLNFKIYKGTESSIKFCIAETTITSKFWRMSTVI